MTDTDSRHRITIYLGSQGIQSEAEWAAWLAHALHYAPDWIALDSEDYGDYQDDYAEPAPATEALRAEALEALAEMRETWIAERPSEGAALRLAILRLRAERSCRDQSIHTFHDPADKTDGYDGHTYEATRDAMVELGYRLHYASRIAYLEWMSESRGLQSVSHLFGSPTLPTRPRD